MEQLHPTWSTSQHCLMVCCSSASDSNKSVAFGVQCHTVVPLYIIPWTIFDEHHQYHSEPKEILHTIAEMFIGLVLGTKCTDYALVVVASALCLCRWMLRSSWRPCNFDEGLFKYPRILATTPRVYTNWNLVTADNRLKASEELSLLKSPDDMFPRASTI